MTQFSFLLPSSASSSDIELAKKEMLLSSTFSQKSKKQQKYIIQCFRKYFRNSNSIKC